MVAPQKQVPVSDLPTGDPIPEGPPSTSPSAPAPKLPLNFLLTAPANADAFLAHLHRCMSTPAGIDTVLMFVGYTARLTSELLDAASRNALQQSAHRLISLAFSLPPNTSNLLEKAPRASPIAAFSIKLAARLCNLANFLSEGRTFMRCWALLGIYFWGRRLVLSTLQAASSSSAADKEKSPTDAAAASQQTLDRTISWLQFVSIASFQVLENAAFLSSKGILGLTPAQQGKAYRSSARFFTAFVGTELGRLAVEYHRRKNGDVNSEEHMAWKDLWQRTLIRQMAWAPVAAHWSFGQGFLNNIAVWGLASVPATVSMRQLWKENRAKKI